jgi:hypothetical protein
VSEIREGSLILKRKDGRLIALSECDLRPTSARELRRACRELHVGDELVMNKRGLVVRFCVTLRIVLHAKRYPPKPLSDVPSVVREVTGSEYEWVLYCGTCLEPLEVLAEKAPG